MKFFLISFFILTAGLLQVLQATVRLSQTGKLRLEDQRNVPNQHDYWPTPTCQGTTIVNPPNDLSKPYYWPPEWNENKDPLPNYFHMCSILFNVPKGLYAKLMMKGELESTIWIYDNRYDQFVDGSMNLEPYFFVHNNFNVSFNYGNTFNQGTFGMKVVWSMFPNMSPDSTTISNGTLNLFQAQKARNGFVITTDAGSSISVVAMPNNSSYSSLRNTLIFDGPTYYSAYGANLYELLYRQFVSSGNSVTIFTFEPENTGNMYVIQDWRDTVEIETYSQVICDDSKKNCNILLGAGLYGTSAAISVSYGGETLLNGGIYDGIDSSIAGNVSVYSGVVKDSNLLDKYTPSTIQTNIPHTYNVNIIQYALNSGYANLNITRN